MIIRERFNYPSHDVYREDQKVPPNKNNMESYEIEFGCLIRYFRSKLPALVSGDLW